ncbi:hypothetical protein FQ087_01305 [Sporosarcina sp. ANT_H38]|uniref:hypothetical protein n=1 Tax=Sporosarcina sp. ANT_H38 TaxID=2597358 RepID=UPI0011F2105F|nr:hypothetical protein [Sporosarcina sp. ANT_H38]KAA0964987.1 hypothetical protein FQ087_01305 [Sporosarcina sp. ANT_H38]
MNDPIKQTVSTLTYISVERIMGWFDQKTLRTVHTIHLYADSISTSNNTFRLEHVYDMSYKPFSSGTGFFYLHTTQGVFTFEVDSDPTNFIRIYKDIR